MTYDNWDELVNNYPFLNHSLAIALHSPALHHWFITYNSYLNKTMFYESARHGCVYMFNHLSNDSLSKLFKLNSNDCWIATVTIGAALLGKVPNVSPRHLSPNNVVSTFFGYLMNFGFIDNEHLYTLFLSNIKDKEFYLQCKKEFAVCLEGHEIKHLIH